MQNSPLDMLIMPSFNFSFGLGKPFMVLVFAVFVIIYAIYSIVLFYHWSEYGMKSREVILAESLFTIVSLVLFLAVGVSVYFY